MQPEDNFDPLGSANKVRLGKWLRISRNNVGAFMDELGVLALGRKYPWRRVLECVLGVDADAVASKVDAPLMKLTEAAEELGQPADGLKPKILNGKLNLPPLYVFGPKRSFFIYSQLIECSRSPRNAFAEFPLQEDLFLTPEEVADTMECALLGLEAAFERGEYTEPKHVILTGGAKRYFKSDVQRICATSHADLATMEQALTPAFSGGVLGSVARSVAQAAPNGGR
jgi:hypothetical protein